MSDATADFFLITPLLYAADPTGGKQASTQKTSNLPAVTSAVDHMTPELRGAASCKCPAEQGRSNPAPAVLSATPSLYQKNSNSPEEVVSMLDFLKFAQSDGSTEYFEVTDK